MNILSPDLILVDIVMDDLSGDELLIMLRQILDPAVAIVMASLGPRRGWLLGEADPRAHDPAGLAVLLPVRDAASLSLVARAPPPFWARVRLSLWARARRASRFGRSRRARRRPPVPRSVCGRPWSPSPHGAIVRRKRGGKDPASAASSAGSDRRSRHPSSDLRLPHATPPPSDALAYAVGQPVTQPGPQAGLRPIRSTRDANDQQTEDQVGACKQQ
eukprot:4260591-Prymnesium_polylepis.2